MDAPLYIIGSVLAASLLSALGALLIVFAEDRLETVKTYLVSLSAGAIFGGAFIHLAPRYAEQYGFTNAAGLFIALSVLGSYVLEETIHWHCHDWCHVETFSFLLVIGDSIHNLIDGMIIAGSYFISLPAGIATTLAVMFHKVPKEIGDFGVLLHGGIEKWRAVAINLSTNIFALIGAVTVILLADTQGFIQVLIPLAIGNFIYVAGTDLMPEIKNGDADARLHILVLSLGIALMYSVVLVKPLL